MKNTAIILAAGKGTRMKLKKPKQFLALGGEPMLVKCLRAFEESSIIDEIILVSDEKHRDDCKKLVKNGFHKVRSIVTGGKERYDSVYAGLKACKNCRYVFIHDSARPYVTEEIIKRAYEAVRQYPAVVVGVPSKDTVKIVNKDGLVTQTPPRDRVWIIQTPQVFRYDLIREAYDIMSERSFKGLTDDAMVLENSGLSRVRVVEGSYENIKITTPEDLKEDFWHRAEPEKTGAAAAADVFLDHDRGIGETEGRAGEDLTSVARAAAGADKASVTVNNAAPATAPAITSVAAEDGASASASDITEGKTFDKSADKSGKSPDDGKKDRHGDKDSKDGKNKGGKKDGKDKGHDKK